MDHDIAADEDLVLALPARLETTSFFSPVIVVAPQIAIAVNAADFGGEQVAGAMNAANAALALG